MQGPRSHTFPKPHVMLPRPPRRVGRCRGATAITERVHLRAEVRTGAAGRGRSHRSKSPDTRRHRHWAWSPTAGPERKTARSGQGEWRGAGKLAGSAWGWEARPAAQQPRLQTEAVAGNLVGHRKPPRRRARWEEEQRSLGTEFVRFRSQTEKDPAARSTGTMTPKL